MDCQVVPGEASDTVQFSRSGVRGELLVCADRFELTAQLGFLLGAFSQRIERKIVSNLDALLGSAGESEAVGAAPQAASSAAVASSSPAAPAPRAKAPRRRPRAG